VTLLYIDGFAHQSVGRYTSGTTSFFTNGVALGAPQNYGASTANLVKAIPAASEVFTGFRFRAAALSASTILGVLGDTQATSHLVLTLNATTGVLELRRGTNGGTLLASGATAIATGAWNYIEVRSTIADSGGICQVRLNGSTSNEIDFTGDTKNAGTATTVDGLRLGSGNSNFFFADWYVVNTAGTSPTNSWLGDTVVRTLVPTGDGDLSQLTGSDGNQVSNWQQVDELPPASTDYNGSPTVGNEDTYALADLPSTTGVSVYGVQVSATIAKSDAGTANAQPVLRLSGTDYTTTARTLSTTYTEYPDLYEKNPGTSTYFTAAEVNAAQVGMKVA
jgi:hypothetical protein